ncbi:unnamed protein product [Rotaria magnacalcarata]|uniref:Uncharacterized protein n=3 Tax=Rotaria magnacalcarata TaxID=392030 RepID=A0A816PMY5_9BILA|nr:unnamed protein product [Rotaria magnacalcarata]CAF1639499.1 unnamed protein product [Rotaria magnacalcarata]CAF2050368.1 unnamed protein product [Rotaria magnacalcarata]CAF2057219.1 unnamed protein product [Rotaria magnacalcarata]CAF2215593.1 unnamed protein product [Rotaria magnacalcarata]
MTTTSKRRKKPLNRKQSSDAITKININQLYDLVDDHNFIAANEICSGAIGLFSVLFNRNIIDASFSKLYQQSLQCGWEYIFTQERQKLKPNDISVLKSLVLNRLLNEYSKDSNLFVQKTKYLYDEIHSRMARNFPAWTPEDFSDEVGRWQDIQCRRRLFYFDHQELSPLCGLLMLQKAATNWCHCLIKHCQQNRSFWETEGPKRFRDHFQRSFIIVAQPTGPENVPVTQYIKTASGHTARLHARIICLLDPDILKDYLELSAIDVMLYPLNREANGKTEKEPSITWEIRQVMSAEGIPVSVYYAEMNTLDLGNFDCVYKRLSFNSTLCQLEFRIKIKVKNPAFEDTIILNSQPFGICSHGQYFPKFIAQLFTYEMDRILKNNDQLRNPEIIAEFLCRYYKRMVRVEPMDSTKRFFREIFSKILEDSKKSSNINALDNLNEEILTKVISQIHFIILNPVLSLMYNDGLFLGICDSTDVDKMLNGTQQEPHLLLRFNNVLSHHWNANPTVNCIIHDGFLRKASFDMKTFANELCRFICESVNTTTKKAIVFSAESPHYFADFRLYFHNELNRLNKMSSLISDTYDPLLPVLWMTLRQNDDNGVSRMENNSDNSTPRAKRHRSGSSPFIESVASVSSVNTASIVVNLDNKDETSFDSSNNLSPSSHNSMLPDCTTSSSSTTITDEACQSNSHEPTAKARQFIIDVPGDIEISPAVLFRHLAEKFSDSPNDVTLSNYLILSKQSHPTLSHVISITDSSSNNSHFTHSINNLHSSSDQMPKIESTSLLDLIPDDPASPLAIKEEPRDNDCIV